MAKTLADVWAESRQRQVDAGHAALEQRIGQRAIWHRANGRFGGYTSVCVTVEGVKYTTVAWYLVRDADGKAHRVRRHNLTFKGERGYYEEETTA